MLAQGGYTRPGSGLSRQHVQGPHGVRPADAVDVQSRVVLKVGHGPDRFRAENPVDTPAIKTDSCQQGLKIADVVTTHVGGSQHQQAVTEPPASLDDGFPGVFVADPRNPQTPRVLKETDG